MGGGVLLPRGSFVLLWHTEVPIQRHFAAECGCAWGEGRDRLAVGGGGCQEPPSAPTAAPLPSQQPAELQAGGLWCDRCHLRASVGSWGSPLSCPPPTPPPPRTAAPPGAEGHVPVLRGLSLALPVRFLRQLSGSWSHPEPFLLQGPGRALGDTHPSPPPPCSVPPPPRPHQSRWGHGHLPGCSREHPWVRALHKPSMWALRLSASVSLLAHAWPWLGCWMFRDTPVRTLRSCTPQGLCWRV